MMKVLIVDDELLVQVGLKSLIQWEDYHAVVVGDAKNGAEAIALFDKLDPDLVIIDIGMPEMNGLELLRILVEKKPSVKAVFLTSHTEFQYVKEAIHIGACDYILKSELTREKLIAALEKIARRIESESSVASQKPQPVNTDLFQIYDDDLIRLVTGLYQTEHAKNAIIKKYEIETSNKKWIVAMASLLVKQGNQKRFESNPNHFKSVIMSLNKQIFTEKEFTGYSNFVEKNILYLFAINSQIDPAIIVDKVLKLFQIFKGNLNKLLSIDLLIGLSDVGSQFEQINQLYLQAYRAREISYFEDNKIILFSADMQITYPECPAINFDAIGNYFQKSDPDGLTAYLNTLFDKIAAIKAKEYVKSIFFDLLGQAKVYSEMLHHNQDKPMIDMSQFSYDVFQELTNFKSAREYMINIYSRILQAKLSQLQQMKSYNIKRSIEFIDMNFSRNISLTDVADYVGVSKNYLSFLFKQELGVNFSSYLLNLRIRKAKEYLASSNLKLYEISEKVGFENPYYFSKVFKEIVGLTCKEYKKIHSKTDSGLRS